VWLGGEEVSDGAEAATHRSGVGCTVVLLYVVRSLLIRNGQASFAVALVRSVRSGELLSFWVEEGKSVQAGRGIPARKQELLESGVMMMIVGIAVLRQRKEAWGLI
jgi:hypothetical protein